MSQDDEDFADAVARRLASAMLDDPRAQTVLGQIQDGIGSFQSLIDKLGQAIEEGPRRPSPSQRYYPRPRPQPRHPSVPESDPRHPRQQTARKFLGLPLSGPLTKAQITQARRNLARMHHPDRGGDPERMQTVNNCADYLVSLYTAPA